MKVEPSLRPGANRTGLAVARGRRAMLAPPPELGPTARGSIDQIDAVRIRYARTAEPTGTMPDEPHASPVLLPLLDLLGARLAVERLAVRLYEALITKREAYGAFDGGPERRELVHLRDDEHQHARMLDGVVADLGADPTAVTPGASRELVTLRGIAEVLLDPRTSLLDGLEAVLVAELADHEQWSNLIELARELRADDLVRIFVTAQTTQEEHLSMLRRWISSGREAARVQLVERGR